MFLLDTWLYSSHCCSKTNIICFELYCHILKKHEVQLNSLFALKDLCSNMIRCACVCVTACKVIHFDNFNEITVLLFVGEGASSHPPVLRTRL